MQCVLAVYIYRPTSVFSVQVYRHINESAAICWAVQLIGYLRTAEELNRIIFRRRSVFHWRINRSVYLL